MTFGPPRSSVPSSALRVALGLLVSLLVGLHALAASAATLRVAGDGSGDHLTIGAAIAAALDGDEIVIAAGTYTEDLLLDGRSLTLRGEDGSAETFLVGTGLSPVVDVTFGLDARPVLEGLDISGGTSLNLPEPFGGCVRAVRTALVLVDIVLHDCSARDGGGLGLDEWTGTIDRLRVHDTSSVEDEDGGNGGGIWLRDTEGSLDRVVIHDTTADQQGAGLYISGGFPSITRLRVARALGAWGGGVMLAGTSATLERVVLTANDATLSGGALSGFDGGTPTVRRLQAYGNTNTQGVEPFTNGGGGLWFDNVDLTMEVAAIALNHADGLGGGMAVQSGDVAFDRLLVMGNEAYDSAGAAIWSTSSTTLARSRISTNIPTDLIGNAYIITDSGLVEGVVFDSGSSTWSSGCARLGCSFCPTDGSRDLLVRNSIFDDCSANEGAAFSVRDGAVRLDQVTVVRADGDGVGSAVLLEGFDDPSSLAITGSIIADSLEGSTLELRSEGTAEFGASIEWTLYEPGPDGTFLGLTSELTLGDGLISGSPEFVGTDITDWATYLQLTTGSLGKDDGDPLGALDPDNTVADLGAYGGPRAVVWQEGDVDGDGVTIWERDCDDDDPAVRPGVLEICNCIDDDCDFVVDEGGCPDPCAPDDWDPVIGDDDDDSSADDDDATGDDDDATGDDDDATGDDDDDDLGLPPGVGCLLRCDAGGASGVSGLGLSLGALTLLGWRRRARA